MSRAKKAESTAKTKDKPTKPRKPAAPSQAQQASPHPDWDRIEFDYRAGVKTLRQMADEHGISEGTIRKRAKREGWTRDLSVRIHAKAEELVRKETVRSEVRNDQSASEKVVVEANAQAIADVILGHRKDIRRSMLLVTSLTDSLEQMSSPECQQTLEQLGILMFQPDDKGQDKLNDLYRYIISLPAMIKMIKSLSETLRILIDAQRKSFGVDDKYNPNTDDNEKGGGYGFNPKALSEVERAVRLSKLLNSNRALLSELTPAKE